MRVDTQRILQLARELIAANSENPPGREAEAARVLREHMEAHGISCRTIGSADRPNLVFSTHEEELGPLLFHGHLDTVPAGPEEQWNVDPFKGEVVGDRLYGRGACDMKGPLACLAETLLVYAQERNPIPLALLATADEESGCSGAEEVAQSGVLSGVRYGVCAEPTGLNVLVGEKGMLWTRIVATGKAAHASRPEEGVNAIELCIRALDVLTRQGYSYEPNELMGRPTISVGRIRGGIKINVVPDRCEAEIDMRLVAGQSTDSVLAEMRSRIVDAGLSDSVSVEYIHGKPAVITPCESPIVRVACDAVEAVTGRRPEPHAAPYGTDCSVLQPRLGIINVICGPGSIEQAHQPNEFIRIESLTRATQIYLRIASRIGELARTGIE